MEDIKNVPPASDEDTKPEIKIEGEQDLLKNELEKVKTKKTQKEKLIFKQKEISRQLQELDGDGEDLQPSIEDDEKPLTIGEFKKIQAKNVTKTALQLADEIQNESERELVKHYLQNKIVSSGNPQEDLSDARTLANKIKNAKIAEMATQKPGVIRTASNGGGLPFVDPEADLTPQEISFMTSSLGKSFTKKEILELRKKTNKEVGVQTTNSDTQV